MLIENQQMMHVLNIWRCDIFQFIRMQAVV